MTIEELKDWLIERGYTNTVVFEQPDYLSAIIGINYETGALIYSYDLMIEHIVRHQHLTYDEALEFLEYNTIRAISYITDGVKPIILYPIS